jgi:hypothetical protein
MQMSLADSRAKFLYIAAGVNLACQAALWGLVMLLIVPHTDWLTRWIAEIRFVYIMPALIAASSLCGLILARKAAPSKWLRGAKVVLWAGVITFILWVGLLVMVVHDYRKAHEYDERTIGQRAIHDANHPSDYRLHQD